MKILHYSLGFPPYRSGGLTKYCVDLMEQQTELGNSVCLLWPGRIKIINKKVKIKKNKNYKNIKSYEIINPLPVPLLNGISKPDDYTKKCNKNVYKTFLSSLKPDVIHIHSLMGLHKEFLEIANEMKIKVVFTSHDYFGLCPKVNLYSEENIICSGIENKKCTECCIGAFSNKKIYILQSKLYRKFKGTLLFSVLKEKLNKTSKEKEKCYRIVDYSNLKEYYRIMFGMIDEFYFNSLIAYNVFRKQKIPIKKYYIIPITHNNINDNRVKKEYNNKELHIGYIAAPTYAKGFNTLINVLDKLNNENMKFRLEIYYPIYGKIPTYININKHYTYKNFVEELKKIDVMVIPSNWNETFGFGVIEALSQGIPVICSENVGASYILKDNEYGYVYKTQTQLENIIKKMCLSKEILNNWNDNIINAKDLILNMKFHTIDILQLYIG